MEDILENKFLQTLQNNYSSLYKQVQSNCWLIAVPHSRSLPDGFKFTKEIIENHIFKPSPLYTTVYDVPGYMDRSIVIDGTTLHTQSGFPQQREAKILFEELFYNQEYKQFRVLCIDRPLLGGPNLPLNQSPDYNALTIPSPKQFSESMEYLRAFPENEIVLRKIDTYVEDFKESYILVKGFESDAREKVAMIVETSIEMLLCANIDFRKMQNNSRQLKDLSLIIESYVTLGLFNKLCTGIRLIREVEDLHISTIIKAHKHNETTLADLGVAKHLLKVDLNKAQKELVELDYCKTPLQMLFVLKDCIAAITDAVQLYFKLNPGDALVTTDDFIPIIAYIITRSAFQYYESTLLYIELFIFEDISNSELGYALSTFKAALTYLSSEEQVSKILGDISLYIPDNKPRSKYKGNNVVDTLPHFDSNTRRSRELVKEPNPAPLFQKPPSVINLGFDTEDLSSLDKLKKI